MKLGVKNPFGQDWIKEELEIIKRIFKPKKVSKADAKKVWDKMNERGINLHFPRFEDYWEDVKNYKPKLETRCENCINYPCEPVKNLYTTMREMVICWVFHGSASHLHTKGIAE